MLQDTVQEKPVLWLETRKEQLLAMEKPAFSQDFLLMLAMRLQKQIEARLRKRCDEKGVAMLNDLVMLWIHQNNVLADGGQTIGLNNEDMTDIVGRLSYLLEWPMDLEVDISRKRV